MNPSHWYELGVEARRAGQTHRDNPLLLPTAASFVAGDPKLWRVQMDAWWEGWEAEDRRRQQGNHFSTGDKS